MDGERKEEAFLQIKRGEGGEKGGGGGRTGPKPPLCTTGRDAADGHGGESGLGEVQPLAALPLAACRTPHYSAACRTSTPAVHLLLPWDVPTIFYTCSLLIPQGLPRQEGKLDLPMPPSFPPLLESAPFKGIFEEFALLD